MNTPANKPVDGELREAIADIIRTKSHYHVAETPVLNDIMRLIAADRQAWLKTILPERISSVGDTERQIGYRVGFNSAIDQATANLKGL